MSISARVPTAVDVLAKGLSFAEERQNIILNNLANMDTPFYKARRAPVAEFQKALSRAIDDRRRNPGSKLIVRGADGVRDTADGLVVEAVRDESETAGILRHDQNNVSLEKEMSASAENVLMYRTMADLLRKQFALMQMAASERVQ